MTAKRGHVDIPFELIFFKSNKQVTKQFLTEIFGPTSEFKKCDAIDKANSLVQNDDIEIVNCRLRQKQVPEGFGDLEGTLVDEIMKAMKKEYIKGYMRVVDHNNFLHKFLPMNIEPEERCPLAGLAFGTLINLFTFIPHFTSSSYKTREFHISKSQEDFRVRFSHGKNEVSIAFRLTSGGYVKGQKNGIYNELYKFVIKYKEIGYIVVSPVDQSENNSDRKVKENYKEKERSIDGRRRDPDSFKKDNLLDVYLVLINQPLLTYQGHPQSDVRDPRKEFHATHSLDVENRPFHRVLSLPADYETVSASEKADGIPSVNYKQLDTGQADFQLTQFLHPEFFAKSNVIKLTMTRSECSHFIDPIQIVSAFSTFVPECPVYWSKVSMEQVLKDEEVINNKESKVKAKTKAQVPKPDDRSGKRKEWTDFAIPKNWPFPVKYAIKESFSKSYFTQDDLILNRRKNSFKKLIQESLNVSQVEKDNILENGDINTDIEEQVSIYKKIKQDWICEVFHDLVRQLERCAIIDTMEFLERNLEKRLEKKSLVKQLKQDADSTPSMLSIRRVIITPGRVICCPPEPHLTSRFLLEVDIDSLIKVSFRDENLMTYTITLNTRGNAMKPKGVHTILNESVRKPGLDGVLLLDRKFEFLASGASQLRVHTVLLYALDKENRTAAEMQSKIGDLSSITNVSKYIARMGQSMSQAIARIDIPQSQVVDNFPDMIKKSMEWVKQRYPTSWEGNMQMDHNFSDGCGMISIEKAQQATKQLYPNLKYTLSCFQVRRAGCKGVLVVNPNLQQTLRNNKKWLEELRNKYTEDQIDKIIRNCHLVFRDSMKKFESDNESLELIKGSLVRPVHLNRSFITVLNQLQVPQTVFMELLMKYLNFLSNCFLHESSARSLLREYSSVHDSFPGLDQIFSSSCPINILNEPFVRKTLDAVVRGLIADLKAKSRIRIPFDAARHMIGVVDETGTLKKGQIFVQCTKARDWELYDSIAVEEGFCQEKSERQILTGEVMVTKAPTMVIGDVRKFEAVDVPSLHHICDCIVFPSDRYCDLPHPSEMAGSDLDGDEYVVIWYKPLLFAGDNKDPLNFPDKLAKPTKDITIGKIMQFIIDFIQDDNVGLIASSHLAKSDRDPNGTDEECLRLAEAYSMALDAPKTGRPASLAFYDYASIYPDYMEKEAHKGIYISDRVLGNIYRQVSVYEMLVPEHVNVRTLSTIHDQLLLHRNWRMYEKSAKRSYDRYHDDMSKLVRQFNAIDEESLISQSFISLSSNRELKDMKKVVEKQVKEIIIKYRQEFEEEFDPLRDPFMTDTEREERRMVKASAWFMVARRKLSTDSNASLAFPWIAAEHLAKLSKINMDNVIRVSKENNVVDQCIQVLDQALADGHGAVMSNSKSGGRVLPKPYKTYPNQEEMSLEDIIEAARGILLNWLDSQTHLGLESHLEKKQEMTLKILDILHEAYLAVKYREVKKPSIGRFIMITFSQIISPYLKKAPCDVWVEKSYDFKYPLELTALITYTKFCRSHDTDCILSPQLSSPLPKTAASFFMDLRMKSIKGKVMRTKDHLEVVMEKACGVDKIVSQFDEIGNQMYLRINAYGTKWNLIQLKNIIAQKDFLSFVLNRIETTFCPRYDGDKSDEDKGENEVL